MIDFVQHVVKERVVSLSFTEIRSDELGELPAGWEKRVHADGRIFYIDHNTRRTQWEDPRFENRNIAGPAVPYSRDYKCKYEYLRSHLPKSPTNIKCEITVRRIQLFEDSYRYHFFSNNSCS